MNIVFYLSSLVAIVATILVLTREIAVHALLYLVVSLLAVALIFFTLGAPFIAALEVITYAGAIMVLFVFVIMMLNLTPEEIAQQRSWWTPAAWVGPAILALVLLGELILSFSQGWTQPANVVIDPSAVGSALFGPYLLAVELASMVLLAGLVGAYHLGQRDQPGSEPGNLK